MPLPVLDPMPPLLREFRFSPPEDAQDASYFAASARISSLSATDRALGMFFLCSSYPRLSTKTRTRVPVFETGRRRG